MDKFFSVVAVVVLVALVVACESFRLNKISATVEGGLNGGGEVPTANVVPVRKTKNTSAPLAGLPE